MPGPIQTRYQALVAEGSLESDPAQARIVATLDQLAERLEAHRLARKGSALGWLFGRKQKPEPLKGLYLWGSVGRGKTMLMDLFHENSASGAKGGRISTPSWRMCINASTSIARS